MAELGAIASIIGIAQFGFSLATQITTYIGDYQDAAEDIQNLAGEIVSTYRHVEQLQGLIDQHAIKSAFSPSGLLEADDCKIKARKLAERLWTLLKKSNAEVQQNGSLSADDIDLSIFSKAMWPRFKPRVEQHKRELVVLNQNILIAMVDYRLSNGGSPADQARATEERDRLTKSKQRALKLLKEAQEERRRAKAKDRQRRPRVSFDLLPPGRQNSRSERAPPPAHSHRRSSRGASYDQDASDFRRDSGGAFVPDEAFMDRLEEDLRNDIVTQLHEDEADKEMQQRKTEEARLMAVTEYKNDLLAKLKQSQDEAEDLRKALVQQFPNNMSETAVARFVDQRQSEMFKDDELALLINEAVVQHPVNTQTLNLFGTSDNRNNKTKPRRDRLREYFMLIQEWRGARQRRKDKTSSAASNTQSQIFSVIASVDGDLRQVCPIKVPTTWTDYLIDEQDTRVWWGSKSFKRTMQTYARMDWTTRSKAEEEADRQGIDANDLVLLYARQLDKNTTKGRKLLEATMMASNPWDYYHGRVLLIYKIGRKSDGSSVDSYYDTSNSSSRIPRRRISRSKSKPDRPRGYGDYDSDAGSRRSRSRSSSRSGSPLRPSDPGPYEADIEINRHGLQEYGGDPSRLGSRRQRSYAPAGEMYLETPRRRGCEDDFGRHSWRYDDYKRPFMQPQERGNSSLDPRVSRVSRDSRRRQTSLSDRPTRLRTRNSGQPVLYIYNEFTNNAPNEALRIPSQQSHQPNSSHRRPPPRQFAIRPHNDPPYRDYHRRDRDDENDTFEVIREADSYYEGPWRSRLRSPPPFPRGYYGRGSYAESAGPSTRTPTYDDGRIDGQLREAESGKRKEKERKEILVPDSKGGSIVYRSRSRGYDFPSDDAYDDTLREEYYEASHDIRRRERDREIPGMQRGELWELQQRNEDMRRGEMDKRASRERADKEYARHKKRHIFSRSRSDEPVTIIRERSAYGSQGEQPQRRDDDYIVSRRGYGSYDEPAPDERSSSVHIAAEKALRKRQRERSRLHSRSRQFSAYAMPPPEPRKIAEMEQKEGMDSPSDLFESEDSDDGDHSWDGRPNKTREVTDKHRRSDASTRSSVLGLDTTTASPTALSDNDDGPSSRSKGKQAVFTVGADAAGPGYRKPRVESIAETEYSRRNTGEPSTERWRNAGAAPRRLIEQSETEEDEGTYETPYGETEDDGKYHTAIESHGEDDVEAVHRHAEGDN